MSRISRAVLMGSFMSTAATLAVATPPADSPYATDPVRLAVQDETAQGIGSLNNVLCIIGAMDMGDNVNKGPYVALVDTDRCDPNKGGSSNSASAAAASAADYSTAVVDVTRASNNDPMIGKVWLTKADDDGVAQVFAYVSATQSPAAAPPYGAFRLDYIGKKEGQAGFNGYIDSTQPGVINYLETGPASDNTSLAMSANSTTSGSGTMFIGGNGDSNSSPVTFNFSYNPGFFRRSDGSHDECFDRARSAATIAAWQYGTYNAVDGSRVDQAHPGFPLLATSGGTSYYGFANYYGINFQGLTIPDGTPVTGLTVTDQRQGSTDTYALNKLGGRLTKWSQVSSTLDALDGIPFTYSGDLTGLTSGNSSVTGMNNWVVQWSSSTASFSVVGIQVCSMGSGCVNTGLSPVATVHTDAFTTTPLSGWANSYGGNINIPPTSSAHAASDAVFYYDQSSVIPGTVSLSLHCLNQCPTAAQIHDYASSAQPTPYANGTDHQYFSAPDSAHTVSYSFGASGLLDAAGTAVVWEDASGDSPYAQNGLQTGWLVESAPSTANCPAGSPDAQSGNLCQVASPSTYYTYQTGANQWNQSLWLTSNGSIVPFDPPQNIAYTVPTGASYGSYSGQQILLQFNGFGNLQGIPGTCVNPTDNSPVDCGTSDAQYVPAFSIPDNAAMTLAGIAGAPSTPVIVKALNGAILLKSLGSGASQCATMDLSPLTLPSGGTHDPSSSSDAEYLGAMPTVTGAPKVIDGVLQH
jgi:hypothetical protein